MLVKGLVKRLVVLALAAALIAAACSSGNNTEPSPTASSPTSEPSTSPSPSGSTSTITLEVWFTQGDHLFLTHRTVPETQAVGTTALEALLAGPTEQEAAAAVTSQLPNDTELLGLSIEDGVATVDLNDEYSLGGDEFSQRARLGQVVYTLTQFPTVTGVNFELEGFHILTFDKEGFPVHRPSRRGDYDDMLPAIVVESPLIGETVSNPVTISGTADVFEATVSIRIKDQTGKVIADEVTTASCGSGCRGTYSKEIDYDVDKDQPGTIVVFEASAENGKPINVVEIPVTLTA